MRLLQYITEKLIIIGKGENYGQIVFLAGGAGSGKGFAAKNFMEYNKFKVRDVDEWKRIFIKIDKIRGGYPELRGLDLRKPDDVFKVHDVIKKMGIKDHTLDIMLNDMRGGILPNIMFDITLKDKDDVTDILPLLLEAGYEAKNIHIVWVLTDFQMAVRNNDGRDRIVPEDILLKTHVGAAKTVTEILRGDSRMINNRKLVDGQIDVILNNPTNTVYFEGHGPKDGKSVVIKDFKYIRIKKQGKAPEGDREIRQELADWITDNIPETDDTREMRNYKLEDK